MTPGPNKLSGMSWLSRLNHAVLALAMTVTLAACTPWPNYANGGLAERHSVDWRPVRTARERHDALVRSGSERFFPGRMVEIRNLIDRATREHEGGLPRDAEVSLARAADQISIVEADMQKQSNTRSHPRK